MVDAGHFVEAIPCFEQARALLPEPWWEWEAATWIHAALGDTHFMAGNYESARQALTSVMLCPDALDNAFLWLRRGQVYFELGDMIQAQDCLASAYMLAGDEIFEHEDSKYADFILPKLRRSSGDGQ